MLASSDRGASQTSHSGPSMTEAEAATRTLSFHGSVISSEFLTRVFMLEAMVNKL